MSHTLIVSEYPKDLAGVLRVLHGHNTAAIQTSQVVRRARSSAASATHVVLFLTERDSVAELRELLSTSSAAFLLVAPTSPPRATLARIARQCGAVLAHPTRRRLCEKRRWSRSRPTGQSMLCRDRE